MRKMSSLVLPSDMSCVDRWTPRARFKDPEEPPGMLTRPESAHAGGVQGPESPDASEKRPATSSSSGTSCLRSQSRVREESLISSNLTDLIWSDPLSEQYNLSCLTSNPQTGVKVSRKHQLILSFCVCEPTWMYTCCSRVSAPGGVFGARRISAGLWRDELHLDRIALAPTASSTARHDCSSSLLHTRWRNNIQVEWVITRSHFKTTVSPQSAPSSCCSVLCFIPVLLSAVPASNERKRNHR